MSKRITNRLIVFIVLFVTTLFIVPRPKDAHSQEPTTVVVPTEVRIVNPKLDSLNHELTEKQEEVAQLKAIAEKNIVDQNILQANTYVLLSQYANSRKRTSHKPKDTVFITPQISMTTIGKFSPFLATQNIKNKDTSYIVLLRKRTFVEKLRTLNFKKLETIDTIKITK